MKPETRFSQRVARELAELGPRVWCEKIQQLTKRGTPDYLLCVNGYFFAWELKVGHNKASALQAHTLAKIAAAGGVARVVTPDNLAENMQEIIRRLT